jgi:transcriptional regulator GlxA family with amidase domain
LKQIGILVFPEVEELDAIGPWEVLAFWCRHFPQDGYGVFTLSRDGQPLTCANGLTIHPDHSYEDAPAIDVLIYPGGIGTRPHLHDQAQLDWVRAQREQVPLLASVCTGSLVYAAAGLLRGRPATTYWGNLDTLREIDPSIEVRSQDRYVDAGDMITSAGISAGLDMALYLIGRLTGQDRARQVRRGIQYDPEPPV